MSYYLEKERSKTYYIKTPIGYIFFKSNDISKIYIPDLVTYYCIFSEEELKFCKYNFTPINKKLWDDLTRRFVYNFIYTKIIDNEYSLVFDLPYIDRKSLSYKIYTKM